MRPESPPVDCSVRGSGRPSICQGNRDGDGHQITEKLGGPLRPGLMVGDAATEMGSLVAMGTIEP